MTVGQLKEWLAKHPEGFDDCPVVLRIGGGRVRPLSFGIFTTCHNDKHRMELMLHAPKEGEVR